MNKQIFNVGDKVFDAAFGWGEVTSYYPSSFFPVSVDFDNRNKISYTWDGRLTSDMNPTLSFTEYTLQGFSQEKQIDFPCTGMFKGSTDTVETPAFGICLGKDTKGHFVSEFFDIPFINFQPMTLEEYCKLINIEL